jgi:hypothetical protein
MLALSRLARTPEVEVVIANWPLPNLTAAIPTPTALRPPRQGCSERATLGSPHESASSDGEGMAGEQTAPLSEEATTRYLTALREKICTLLSQQSPNSPLASSTSK